MFRKIACIGGGTIGRSWALLFAMRGCEVNLYDLSDYLLIRADDYIRRWLESLIRNGTIKEEQEKRIMDRIKLTLNMKKAVEDVDYIQESVPENLGLKKKVFRMVSLLVKSSSILASSTSGLSMTEIQEAALTPELCITVHPINPPHLIPLVEIVPGNKTEEDVVKTVYDFMLELKKTPIIVEKEFPGFVFNRLAAALWREALDLLDKGVATVEDIDKAVYAGMGLRWAIMGPFLTYHLGGGEEGIKYFIEHLGPAFSTWWKSMATWTSIPHSAVKKAVEGVNQMDIVKAKTYEELVKWRNEKLKKLLGVLGS